MERNKSKGAESILSKASRAEREREKNARPMEIEWSRDGLERSRCAGGDGFDVGIESDSLRRKLQPCVEAEPTN